MNVYIPMEALYFWSGFLCCATPVGLIYLWALAREWR